MPTLQGSVALLADPVAQSMLQAKTPARFAYNWSDGTPRVVPIGFHWNGAEIVLGTPPDAPKMKALKEGGRGRTDHRRRHRALQGPAHTRHGAHGRRRRHRAGICGYVRARHGRCRRRGLAGDPASPLPRMARIFITPTWVGILGFESRFPSALERAMESMQGNG